MPKPHCSPGTNCDEFHIVNTRDGEIIAIGQLVFAAAGRLRVIDKVSRLQVFGIDFQPDTAGGYQVQENDIPVSGHWQLAKNQFFGWGGKYVYNDVWLQVDQPCVVQFEARYRQF